MKPTPTPANNSTRACTKPARLCSSTQTAQRQFTTQLLLAAVSVSAKGKRAWHRQQSFQLLTQKPATSASFAQATHSNPTRSHFSRKAQVTMTWAFFYLEIKQRFPKTDLEIGD